MKKTNTMRVAVLLLALALVTSCFVGGTFAKYTSSISGKDNARVAYWGFASDSTITISDLFTYTDEGVYNDGDVAGLIAPGTTNSKTFEFAWNPAADTADDAAEGITGTATAPEVDYTFDVTVTGNCAEAIQNNPNIQWKLDNGEWGTWTALIAAIDDLGENAEGGNTYEAGTLPTGFEDGDSHTISWQWIFETADDADTDGVNEMAVQDALDTSMGNSTEALKVYLAITVTATQVN